MFLLVLVFSYSILGFWGSHSHLRAVAGVCLLGSEVWVLVFVFQQQLLDLVVFRFVAARAPESCASIDGFGFFSRGSSPNACDSDEWSCRPVA